MFLPSRVHDVTKHLPALFVKPVFTPLIPFKFPSSSFVLYISLCCPFIKIVFVLQLTISENLCNVQGHPDRVVLQNECY